MNSTTYNAQFLTIDFRLLDDPAFCKFMRSAAFPVYMLLRRYVWRGTKRKHPVDKVNELYRDGFLVAALPREMLAKKLELRNVASVSRHLAELEKLNVIRTVKTGRQNVYMLGTWEDRSLARDGSYVIEIFLLEQRHGAELYDQPRHGDVALLRFSTRSKLRSSLDGRDYAHFDQKREQSTFQVRPRGQSMDWLEKKMLPDLHQVVVRQIVRIETIRQIDDGDIGKPLANRRGSTPPCFVAIHQNGDPRQITEQTLLRRREMNAEQGHSWNSQLCQA